MKNALMHLVVFLFAASAGLAQESHVVSRYEKSIDRTIVHSDVLYVVNTPSQFMQIQLIGRYPGKGKPSQMPDRIYFEFYSFAPSALYQPDAKHRLLVKADAKVLDFGLLTYSNVEGKKKDPKDISNPKAPKSNLGFSVSLPSAAVVTTAHKKDELTVEFMSIDELSLADLKLLARANEVAMKIGDTVFPLRPMQKTILREFADTITPANADAISPPPTDREELPADLPSAANQTQLADTLRWLKTHIERHGATNDVVRPRRFEPLAFDNCEIAYRVVPLIRTSQVSPALINPIMQYRINLADINPEAVRVSDLGDYATVTMTTRDYQPKIKLFTHANDGGTMGRTLEDALTETASINFKNKDAALQFRKVLAHASNLCKAQQ
ncbi:MAG TPA: hypothetical protein VFX97_06230 [Pyrinomonadaceae bacterium]|nr:hypothetical protein [Pyrinomonadaceae bacterium]